MAVIAFKLIQNYAYLFIDFISLIEVFAIIVRYDNFIDKY